MSFGDISHVIKNFAKERFRWRLAAPSIALVVMGLVSSLAVFVFEYHQQSTFNHILTDDLKLINTLSAHVHQIDTLHRNIMVDVKSSVASGDAGKVYDLAQKRLDQLYLLIEKIKQYNLSALELEQTGQPGKKYSQQERMDKALDEYYWNQATTISMLTVDLDKVLVYQQQAGLSLINIRNILFKITSDIITDISQDMTEQIEQLRNIRYIIMISIAVFLLVTLSWSTSRMYYFINALNQIAMVLKQLANGNSSVSMPELEDDPDLSSMVLHLRAYQSLHKKMGEVNEELNSVNKGLEEAVAKRTESLQLEVNERRRDEARLNLFGLAFENTDDALIITDEKANIIYVNDAHSRITGYSPAEVIGKNPRQFKSHHHDEEFYKSMWHDLNSNGSWSGEIWDKRKNGEVFPKWLTINRAVNELNEAEHYIGIFHDISTAKENEIQLEKMAYQDPLTSLYNRSKFFEIINEQLHRYNRYSESFSLVYIDLDYFKPVNDDFGHNIGDAVLIEVAQRIRQCIRDMDIAFRLGGDEFALIIPYLDDQEKIDYVVTRILTAINRPFFIDKYEISISCSIGIASCPTNGIESAGLMHSADQAMYESKDKGRGCYSFSQAN